MVKGLTKRDLALFEYVHGYGTLSTGLSRKVIGRLFARLSHFSSIIRFIKKSAANLWEVIVDERWAAL